MDDLLQVLNSGIQAKREGKYQQAIEYNQMAIRMAPHDARAYKNISKVLIGTGNYMEAIRALLMKVQLGMYYTNSSPDRAIIEETIRLKQHEAMNDAHGNFSAAIRIGEYTYSRYMIPTLMSARTIWFDIAKLMWAEDDLYFYLGHCYIRQFPEKFTSYCLPSDRLNALELSLLGCPTEVDDLREDPQLAPLFYIVGFLVCVANIHENMIDNSEETVFQRLRREITVDLTLGVKCSDS